MNMQWLYNNSLLISSVCLVISLFIFVISNKVKIKINDIIKKHLSTLKDFGAYKKSFNDIAIFFIMPIFIAIPLTININLDDTKLGILVTVFTLFTGLLFNILAILLAFDGKKNDKLDKKFMKEILYNVSFAIILSILVLIICILRFIEIQCYFKLIIDLTLYYLVIAFIITLIMILKRLFILLENKINES
ncbi:hypothetical protein [Clostridium perfringens]|uniref:hypothetical protein n=2 Tax=Clostridium perfringens TaxID=1502 RepID=UPI0003178E9A|nr:hypothetical protein [Clostridium perfringens]EHK2327669.1 hypothetical protein [Clostridium perfringens]ELC8395547.1 hypothetical protein [Clostridium perfringens]MBI6012528.1 hypothetical protein [Clostridium perfringens]MDM0463277.1 hypothetical protein [Clostridium perfringens]MDM0687613.1 hypothetical protein [Clostridium perfringens]